MTYYRYVVCDNKIRKIIYSPFTLIWKLQNWFIGNKPLKFCLIHGYKIDFSVKSRFTFDMRLLPVQDKTR